MYAFREISHGHIMYGLPSDRRRWPIFVCGCDRSGNNLLLSLLDVFPEVAIIALDTYAFRPDKFDNLTIGLKKLNSEARKSLESKQSALRFAERTPSHINHVEKIMDAFEYKALFLVPLRDGREVITSKHPFQKDKNRYWVEPGVWIQRTRASLDAKKRFPLNVKIVRYERMIKERERIMADIADFLEIDLPADWYQTWKNRRFNRPFEDALVHRDGIRRAHHPWRDGPEGLLRQNKLLDDPDGFKLLLDLGYLNHG